MSGYAIDGQALKRLREERRMTPTRLAELVGCSAGHMRLVERNVKKPSLELIARLENALGVTAADLGANLPPPAPTPEQSAEKETPATISAD